MCWLNSRKDLHQACWMSLQAIREGKDKQEGDKVRIRGGTDIGITAGDVFEVFGKAEAVKSVVEEIIMLRGLRSER